MITVFNNERVKGWTKLSQKKFRQQENCFLVEGIRLVEEAFKSNAFIRTAIVSPKLSHSERGASLEQKARAGDWEVVEVSDEILARIADTETPQGIALVIEFEHTTLPLFAKDSGFWVVVDGLQDPGNLGTIIRTCHGAKANGLFLTPGTVDLYNPKTVRATMGSLFHLSIRAVTTEQLIEAAKQNGVAIITGNVNSSEALTNLTLPNPCMLVFGSEAFGCSDELAQAADRTYTIPMPGGSESLNVATAAGMTIYEAIRQQVY